MAAHASKKESMMLIRAAFALSFLIAGTGAALADEIESVGTDVAVALPVIAGGIAVYKGDWNGIGELGIDTLATVGTVYALKHIVREERPDHSDFQSFPSDTVALSASGSSFLWARYGWQYGLPALMASEFVAYSRVEAKKHHWYDTLASSGIAAGYALVFDSRYREPRHFYSELSATPDSAYIHISYNF
jgi:membrane-associated phospholipid phosphatase